MKNLKSCLRVVSRVLLTSISVCDVIDLYFRMDSMVVNADRKICTECHGNIKERTLGAMPWETIRG